MKLTYTTLKEYYKRCFSLFDCFHFNSNHTKECYEKHLYYASGIVIPITHGGIKDNRKKKNFTQDCLRLGFIGSSKFYKGLPLLIDSLKEVGQYGKWILNVWGNQIGQDSTMPIYYFGKYNPSEIESIYANMDVMIVPSQCHETFSLVTLEALSYGVPVLVSNTVGAKDIVKEYNEKFIFSSKLELIDLLKTLVKSRSLLVEYNMRILNHPWHHNMERHTQEIIEKIYKCDD